MSSNLQGFVVREPTGDRFVPAQDVLELRGQYFQRLLEEHHYSATPPDCGCGMLSGDSRPLIVHRNPFAPAAEELTLYCQDRLQHPPSCWLWRAGDRRDDGDIFHSSLFRPFPPGADAASETDLGAAVRRAQDNFSRFASRMISKAQVRAFAGVNLTWRQNGFHQPRAAAFYRAVHSEFSHSYFTEGSAYAAARKEGSSLGFGMIEHDALPCQSPAGQLINVQWWIRGRLISQLVVVDAQVWNDALGAIRVLGRTQHAPYLFVAADDGNGHVHHLRLFACFTNGSFLAITESGGENGFAAHLERNHCATHKPVLRSDMERLIAALDLPVKLPPEGILFRPDYLVLRLVRSDWHCFVIEVRGFKPGKIPAYDRHLDFKKSYFSNLDSHISCEVRDGWEYERSVYDPAPLIWADIDFGQLGESLAAQLWLADLELPGVIPQGLPPLDIRLAPGASTTEINLNGHPVFANSKPSGDDHER